MMFCVSMASRRNISCVVIATSTCRAVLLEEMFDANVSIVISAAAAGLAGRSTMIAQYQE